MRESYAKKQLYERLAPVMKSLGHFTTCSWTVQKVPGVHSPFRHSVEICKKPLCMEIHADSATIGHLSRREHPSLFMASAENAASNRFRAKDSTS